MYRKSNSLYEYLLHFHVSKFKVKVIVWGEGVGGQNLILCWVEIVNVFVFFGHISNYK